MVPSQCLSRALAAAPVLIVPALLAPSAAGQLPDVHEVGIHVDSHRLDGLLLPNSFRFEAEVQGDDLSAVSVQTPSGAVHALVYDVSDDEWRFEIGGLADLCAVENHPGIGFGSFTFTFDGPSGSDQATVSYQPGNPTCKNPPHDGYGDFSFPVHSQSNIDLFPTLQWGCIGVACGSFGWFVELAPSTGPGAEYEGDLFDPAATSWTPAGCLTPNTTYVAYLSAATLLGGVQNLFTSIHADAFVYAAGWETVNEVEFDTRAAVGTSYCATSPNSAGPGATICAAGSSVVASQDLTLVAAGCPEDTPGLFYFGPGQLAGAPFGDGLRCVAVPQSRRMYPFARAGPMNGNPPGTAVRPVDFGAPYAVALTPGASLNFQLWYRDNAAMMAGFNLTDAVNVVFQ